MKLAAISLVLMACGAGAQILPEAGTSARSVSGQFIVLAEQSLSHTRASLQAGTNADLVQLEPTLVAITAERVKQAVWRELGEPGPWRQRTTLVLHPARTADDPVTLITGRSFSGWTCRVELPDQLPRERYLRALVQAVLLELANRGAGERSAEIPVWLVEGLSFQLLANQSDELILTPPRFAGRGVNFTPVAVEARRVSVLEKAHKTLLGTTPLSFEELSWPAPDQLDGPDGPRYRACAQLFTVRLLNLRSGPACLRRFLEVLPGYLNWQLAFLEGFSPHFDRPLEIEKWWSLQASEFVGRDLIQTWTYEDSWSKLADALVQSVDVFATTNALPTHSQASLQTILRDWKPADQKSVLRKKATELGSLRLRLAPELAPLAAEYQQALESFLSWHEPPASIGRLEIPSSGLAAKRAQHEAIERLDRLDARLARMNPNSPATFSEK
jgi:hypothetical protein